MNIGFKFWQNASDFVMEEITRSGRPQCLTGIYFIDLDSMEYTEILTQNIKMGEIPPNNVPVG